MPKNQIASCPNCGGRISFKKFVLLNNFSATNCECCNTRIEISNRNENAILAGISGFVSAVSVVWCSYLGERDFQSLLGGLASGIGISFVIVLCICRYAYRNSKLNRIYSA